MPARSCLVAIALLVAAALHNAPTAAAAPPLLDAPWRGFDTGYYPNNFGPRSLASGDLDGDGRPDLVVGNEFFAGSGLSTLKNNGDGTYAAPVFAPSGEQQVKSVALTDVDADGDLDVDVVLTEEQGCVGGLRRRAASAGCVGGLRRRAASAGCVRVFSFIATTGKRCSPR